MIQRVLERCRESTEVDTVVLCTDSQELQQRAAGWGFPVLMTAESCSSGSDRIASVADALMALAWGMQLPRQSKPL
jgi:3-deoxy-manno-octulosonate cytidylyltransferase (CMP-KDO synthetase)